MKRKTEKRPPSWRELTTEERWLRIAAEGKAQHDALPATLKEARRLVVPVVVILYGVQALVGVKVVRQDVREALSVHVAKACTRLRPDERHSLSALAIHACERARKLVRSPEDYLYAACAATVRLVDENQFPGDSPGGLAALSVKLDVEENEEVTSDALASVGPMFDLLREGVDNALSGRYL